jgi:hypothetical protein
MTEQRAQAWFIWLAALWCFDRGHGEHLAKLIEDGEPIPTEFRRPLADIVSGKRAPKPKALAKLKGDPVTLALAAVEWRYETHQFEEAHKRSCLEHDYMGRLEPSEQRQMLNEVKYVIKRTLAARAGVEVKTFLEAEASLGRLARTLLKG